MKWLRWSLVVVVGILVAHGVLGWLAPVHFDAAAYEARRAAYDVTIKRDRWGVPHVEGKRDQDVAFGLAYAQAEDAYPIIEDAMRFYRGRQSAAIGLDGIPMDYLVQLLRIWPTIDASYDSQLSDAAKELLVGFSDGMNYWAAQHPDQVDRSLYPITPQDIVAGFSIQHLLFYGFQAPVMELFEDTRKHNISLDDNATAFRLTESPGTPIGSNAFAVAPGRASDGATRLLINSHQPLTGPVAWYEAHLKSESGWHVMGGTFPGTPLITLGVNENVGWGATVNKPDLVDIYVLSINPENEYQYRLDGEWVDLEVREAPIRVKLLGNFYWTITQELLYSKHGPVLRTEHGTYAIRYAGQGEIRQIDQWFAMSRATSLDSWRQAMRMLAISSFNFVVADKEGNIGYFHNAQAPVRKNGFDWQAYLPGDRSDLIWQDYLPFDELPQVINPASGFVTSSNQSPFQVTAAEDNRQRSDWPESFGFPTRMTNRATRSLELFAALDRISEQDFRAIKFDKSYSPNSRAIRWLSSIYAEEYPQDSRYARALEILRRWDLATDLENLQAALGVCVLSPEWVAEQNGNPPPPVAPEFERCVDLLQDKFGTVEVPWREVNRLVRGDLSLPVGGGPDVMRAIYGQGLEEKGYLIATGGDGLFIFATWSPEGRLGIETIHQFGSATLDERSPHYADQAALFAEEKMKDPFFEEEALDAHLERAYAP